MHYRSSLVAFAALLAIPALGQQSTLPVPDNLVAEGVPAVPTQIVQDVGRYTEFRSAIFGSWHPVRREMLIRTRFADTAQVHRVKLPGGARTQLTFFAEGVSGVAYDPVDGEGFLFSKDVGGNEQNQLYWYDLKQGTFRLATDGRSQNSFMSGRNRGDWGAYTSNRRSTGDRDVYFLNPRDPKTDRKVMELKGGGWGVGAWSPDDSSFLLSEFISAAESYLWLVDASTLEKRVLTPKTGKTVLYEGGDFSADGKFLYTATDLGAENMRLAKIEIATGKTKILTGAIPWDIDSFALSHDRKRIAFVANEDGVGVLYLMDARTERYQKVKGLPVGLVSNLEWHRNNRDLAFNLNSAQSASDIFSLDVRSGKIDRWTESETGGLDPTTFSTPETIRWKSFDNLTISGFLYRPNAQRWPGRRPVVINIHGGPESQARPGFIGRSNYLINEMGIAILYPNVRGSSGYGKTFLSLDNGFKRVDSYRDIETLLDWIQKDPTLDPSRVVVTGGSYGGHMSFALATRISDRIAGSIPVVGMSNLVTFLENTAEYRRDLRRVEYGDERDPKMREFLTTIAPMNNAEKIRKPMFIVQGKNDPRVPYTEAVQMKEKLKSQGTPVWFLMANDEGHGFAKRRNVDMQFYMTILFFRNVFGAGKS